MRSLGRELETVFRPEASLTVSEEETEGRLNRSMSGSKAVRKSWGCPGSYVS